jgi:hypothetical protein
VVAPEAYPAAPDLVKEIHEVMPLPTADMSVAIQGQNNSQKELIADEQLQLKIFDAVRCLPACVSEYIWRT